MERADGVIFILQRPDKMVLLQQRDGNSVQFPWTWCIPGGTCEGDETHFQALIREVSEEYEIQLEQEQVQFLVHFPSIQNSVYLCSVPQDCIPVMHEGADMKWLPKKELVNIELGFNQSELIPLIEKSL